MTTAQNDVRVLEQACRGIVALKLARDYAIEYIPQFSAMESEIDGLEEWASLWASEAEDEEACIKILDKYEIQNRPYA